MRRSVARGRPCGLPMTPRLRSCKMASMPARPSSVALALAFTACMANPPPAAPAAPAASAGYDAALAQRLGADEYGMAKYVLAFLKAGPKHGDDPAHAGELMKAHLANITRLVEQGSLVPASSCSRSRPSRKRAPSPRPIRRSRPATSRWSSTPGTAARRSPSSRRSTSACRRRRSPTARWGRSVLNPSRVSVRSPVSVRVRGVALRARRSDGRARRAGDRARRARR